MRARPQIRSIQGLVAAGCEDGTQEAPAGEATSYRSQGRDGLCEQQVQLDIIGIHERIREFRIIIIGLLFLWLLFFVFLFVFFDFVKPLCGTWCLHWSSRVE